MPHLSAPLPWPCRFRPLSLRPSPSFPRSRPTTSFHTSSTLRNDNANHYETLGVQSNASAAEIKKQYFHLSKTHHPDHNPHDQSGASARFVKIAEAYAILGSASKRQRYDRDFHHQIHSPSSSSSSSPYYRRGSHHSSSTSTGPAGARPASGLSKRRTHFRGPPPSFYRGGGWGAHGSKRQAQADAAASAGFAGAGASAGAGAASSEYAAGASGGGSGSGSGSWGAGGGAFGWENDVPHFDRDGHFRTQEQQELRRRRRMAAAEDAVSFEGGGSLLFNFLFVGGIISLAVAVPTLFGRMVTRKRKEQVE